MILPITLFVLYSAAAWLMLRSVSAPRLAPFAWATAGGALFAHSDAIVRLMRTVGPFSIGLLEAISLLAWTLAVLGCLIAIERQYRVLGAVLLGSAAVGATATGSGQRYHVDNVPAWELSAHILLSMAAAALLFAAAVTALMIFLLDRRLRAKRIVDLPRVLPPMDVLEKVMFRLIGAGFALLTLALFTGFVFVTNLFEQHLVHKTVLSLTAWALFAILLVGRMRYGWRGRFAVHFTLWGFGVLALAYFGSKFVLEEVFGRHWG